MNNCGGNNERISFSDSLKVVCMSELIDKKPNKHGEHAEFTPGEMELILRLVQNKKPWYKFW